MAKGLTSIFMIAFCGFLIVAYNNCGQRASLADSNGNPIQVEPFQPVFQTQNNGNPYQADASSNLASVNFLAQMCDLIASCHPTHSYLQCRSDIMSHTLINPYFGWDFPALTYGDLVSAEQAGTIVAKPAGRESCVDAFKNLTCMNPEVQNAYDPGLSDPYMNLPALIPNNAHECITVF